MAKFAWYCTCGASTQGSVSPDAKLRTLKGIWDKVHVGEGHAPCDRKTAARARRRQESASRLIADDGVTSVVARSPQNDPQTLLGQVAPAFE